MSPKEIANQEKIIMLLQQILKKLDDILNQMPDPRG
jgi:hypothetical protein